jgi:hypothetical protein
MWNKKNVDGNSFIETLITKNGITLQAVLIEKVNIFKNVQNLFGNFELEIGAYNGTECIENKNIDGLNGNLKQATNLLNKLKTEYENKYK